MSLSLSSVTPFAGMVLEAAGILYQVIRAEADTVQVEKLDETDWTTPTGFERSFELSDGWVHVLPCAGKQSAALDFSIHEMVQCANCGDYFNFDDTETVADEGEVCQDCLSAYYTRCADCGEWRSYEVINHIAGKEVCDGCRDENYAECEACGETLHTDNMRYVDGSGYYCGGCFTGRWTYCDECGEIISRDDVCYDEDHDEDLCHYCYENRDHDDDLHSHGSDIETRFHDYREQDGEIYYHPLEGEMYFGMELELECPQKNRGEVVQRIADSSEDGWYLERDSSLTNGIEVICHCRTFESWQDFWNVFDNSVLRPARESKCTGHDNNHCGIHIHTSLDAWEGGQLFRLFSLLYNPGNYEKIVIISQRTKEQLDQWASLSMGDIGKSKDNIEKKKCPFVTRYAALNMTARTLEFRLFNSSLRLDRVRKNMEFVYAMWRYTAQVRRAVWRGFENWVRKHKRMVPHLYEFMIEKGLLDAQRHSHLPAFRKHGENNQGTERLTA